MNSVEKQARIASDCAFRIPKRQRLLEQPDVTTDNVSVQTQCGGPQREITLADIPPQRIERLLQGTARTVFVAFGPKEGEQLVAADPQFTRHGEDTQDGQPPALSSCTDDGSTAVFER